MPSWGNRAREKLIVAESDETEGLRHVLTRLRTADVGERGSTGLSRSLPLQEILTKTNARYQILTI